MNNTKFIPLLLLSGVSSVAFTAPKAPNVLMIISDDQGYGDYSRWQTGQVETPCLDRLAGESKVFTNFYVEPASAPTRAALLTGRSYVNTGVWSVHYGGDYINTELTILPQVLKQVGYNTALIGKWHSGKGPGFLPQYRGYDFVRPAVMHEHIDNDMTFNDIPKRLENHPYWKEMNYDGWTADKMAAEACEYMSQAKSDEPFFLQLAYVAPHSPWEAPKELMDKYRSKGQSERFAALNALVEHMDGSVGKVLDCVEQLGIEENTIVIFFSDNGYVHNTIGPFKGELTQEEINLRNPISLRDNKGSMYEGGIYSPMMIRWKGKITPGKSDCLAHVMDIMPTLAQIGGLKESDLPEGVEGKSICEPIFNDNAKPKDRIICSAGMGIPAEGVKMFPPLAAGRDRNVERTKVTYAAASLYARDSKFKLVKSGTKCVALYDMVNDRGETTDVSAKFPKEKERLEARLKEWFAGVVANPSNYTCPTYQIGLDPAGALYFNGAAKFTGDMQGNGQWAHSIKASRSGSSTIWNVNVVKSGLYAVYLEADAKKGGTVISVSAGDKNVKSNTTKGRVHKIGNLFVDSQCKQITLTVDSYIDGDVTDYWNLVLEPVK